MNFQYFKVIILKHIHWIEFLESEAKYVMSMCIFHLSYLMLQATLLR